jgi:LmbE family N-acetylglucosaminyl deacetylase
LSARATLVRGAAVVEAALASAANRGFSTRLFADPAGPVVVLSPHFDDAVLSCWSVVTGSGPVQPVNVFAKAPPAGRVTPYDRVCGALDSAAHVRERIAEDKAALAAAGRTPVNLPFLDRQYRPPWNTPSLKAVDSALAQAVPRVARLYAPAGLGFAPHPDHGVARALALAAARSGLPVSLYADLPYAAAFGWPHWVTETAPEPPLDVNAYWQRFERDVPAIGSLRSARVVRLAQDEAERKLAAMRMYRTQFGALDGGPIGVLRNPLIHSFEVFWEVGSAA